MNERKNVLLCVTGSVAAKLIGKVVYNLVAANCKVQVVVTRAGKFFVDMEEFRQYFGDTVKVWTDVDEWPQSGYKRGDPILHIDLGKWADLLLIAPLSANTLAKIAHGVCDNLLTSLVLAWDRDKPVVLAPAMNTNMWTNPITVANLKTVEKVYAARVVPPQSKTLACGDTGVGAMADIDKIVLWVRKCF